MSFVSARLNPPARAARAPLATRLSPRNAARARARLLAGASLLALGSSAPEIIMNATGTAQGKIDLSLPAVLHRPVFVTPPLSRASAAPLAKWGCSRRHAARDAPSSRGAAEAERVARSGEGGRYAAGVKKGGAVGGALSDAPVALALVGHV